MCRAIQFLVVMAGLALVGAGCGGGKSKTVKTEGIVYFENKPLAEAQVVFHPVDASGRVASAITGSDGTFRLTTTNTGDGAAPGDYKITVRVKTGMTNEGMNPTMSKEQREDMMKKMFLKMEKEREKKEKEKDKKAKPSATDLPGIYGDDKNTPLKWTIPSDGPVELRLNSKGS